MSGRALVDEIRSGAGPAMRPPRRISVVDIILAAVAVIAIAVFGTFALNTWFSGRAPRPPVETAAIVAPAAVPVWTEADEAACAARGNAAARDPDTGHYMITNRSVAEGVAGLATRVECKLTRKVTRFCGPNGTAELVAIVNDYANRMDLVQLGLAAQGAPMAIAGGLFGGEAAGGDAVYSSMKADTIAYMKTYDARITKVVRSLGAGGVVKAEDFRPFPFAGIPPHIDRLFAGVTVQTRICG